MAIDKYKNNVFLVVSLDLYSSNPYYLNLFVQISVIGVRTGSGFQMKKNRYLDLEKWS